MAEPTAQTQAVETVLTTADSPVAAEAVTVPLGLGWSLAVAPEHLGARLRLTGAPGSTGLEIEIAVTPEGPVVRTRASALEVTATETVHVACDRFSVAAKTSVDIASGGSLGLHAGTTASTEAHTVAVQATHGGVQLRANDDVQLLGEQILLNCEREPAVPAWVHTMETDDPLRNDPPRPEAITLPRIDTLGDPTLLALLDGTPDDPNRKP